MYNRRYKPVESVTSRVCGDNALEKEAVHAIFTKVKVYFRRIFLKESVMFSNFCYYFFVTRLYPFIFDYSLINYICKSALFIYLNVFTTQNAIKSSWAPMMKCYAMIWKQKILFKFVTVTDNFFTAKDFRIILNDKTLLYSGLFWKF